MAAKPYRRGSEGACRYDTDIVAWGQEQAWLLRSGCWDRLDIEHIA